VLAAYDEKRVLPALLPCMVNRVSLGRLIMAKQKMIDPVDDKKKSDETAGKLKKKALDSSTIKLADLKGIKKKVTVGGSPFEGYPMVDIQIGDYTFKKHHIVFLNPSHEVQQDPSNLGQTVTDGKGRERIVDFETFHSRMVQDSNKQNIDIVFDRVMNIEGKDMYYAIVPDNTARSQVMFTMSKNGKAGVDNRYTLLDTDQASRLKRVFDNFYYQMLAGERKAQKYD
jgi:hypothetical protein